MSLQLLIRPEAEADLAEAFVYYESCQVGLGDAFLTSVKSSLDIALKQPDLYPRLYKNLHRVLTHRFPFGVFYLIDANQLIVIACLHVRRSPNAWRDRMH
jgi:toxin ParE1/3/4